MSDLGNKEIFSKNLRYYMELYEKDRNQICQELNIKYPTFSEWYNAKKYPRIDKIEMLANYFHIKKSDLIESHSFTEQNEPYVIKLRQIRQENNLTLEQLSGAVHIPKETLEQYENGKTIPSTKTLIKLCEYFQVSSDTMLGICDESNFQTNISNNNVLSNNHHTNINIRNATENNPQIEGLTTIFKNLDLKNQTKLLSYAFELENEKKDENTK